MYTYLRNSDLEMDYPRQLVDFESGDNLLKGYIYGSLDAVKAINQGDTPVLIIHGNEDEMVNYNGSAILARVDELTNPMIKSIVQNDTGRNGHNSLFKSKAAIAYIEEVNVEYKALYDHYEENIPYDVKQEFYSELDRCLAQDLDDILMEKIQLFLLECIS